MIHRYIHLSCFCGVADNVLFFVIKFHLNIWNTCAFQHREIPTSPSTPHTPPFRTKHMSPIFHNILVSFLHNSGTRYSLQEVELLSFLPLLGAAKIGEGMENGMENGIEIGMENAVQLVLEKLSVRQTCEVKIQMGVFSSSLINE